MSFRFYRLIYLVVLLFNSQKVVLSYDNVDNKLFISHLKIVTEDESGHLINDRTKYVTEEIGLSYHFSFRNNAKCTEIVYGDDLIWQYISPDSYPRALAFHLDLGQINIQIGNAVHFYQKNGNVWDKKSTTPIDDLTTNGIDLLLEDGNSNIRPERSGVSLNYYFSAIAKCKEVRFMEKPIWAHDENNPFPDRVYFNLFKQIVLIKFPDAYSIFNYRGSGHNLVSETQIVRDAADITIITEDASKSAIKENDVTKYLLKEYDFIAEYVFTDDSKCTEFKHGKNVIWRHVDDLTSDYPKSLCFHRDLNLIFIELQDSIKSFKCNDAGCMIIKSIPHEGFIQSKLTIVTQDESANNTFNNDPSSYVEKTFGFGTEYSLNSGRNCTEIQYEGKPMWNKDAKESDGQLPSKIFFHIYTKMVIVDFSAFYLVYIYQNNRFKFLTKDVLNGITESDFKLMNKDANSSIELTIKNYDFIKYPFGYAAVFMLKEGEICNEAEFRGTSIFKLTGEASAKAMYVNWDMKMLLVESSTFISAYMFLGNRWIQIFAYPESEIRSIEDQFSGDDISQEAKQVPEGKGSEDKSGSLRGSGPEKSEKKSGPMDNKKLLYIIGGVVVGIILLTLALVIFCYLM